VVGAESGAGSGTDEPRLECGGVAAVSGAAVALGAAAEAGAAVSGDEKTNHKVVFICPHLTVVLPIYCGTIIIDKC
jgi:hypothetical protein